MSDKCEYCNSKKIIEEMPADNIYCDIYGRFLRIQGKIFGTYFGRVIKINYCPMCGRKLV